MSCGVFCNLATGSGRGGGGPDLAFPLLFTRIPHPALFHRYPESRFSFPKNTLKMTNFCKSLVDSLLPLERLLGWRRFPNSRQTNKNISHPVPKFWRIPLPWKQTNPESRQDILRFPESRTVFWPNPGSREYPSRPCSQSLEPKRNFPPMLTQDLPFKLVIKKKSAEGIRKLKPQVFA